MSNELEKTSGIPDDGLERIHEMQETPAQIRTELGKVLHIGPGSSWEVIMENLRAWEQKENEGNADHV